MVAMAERADAPARPMRTLAAIPVGLSAGTLTEVRRELDGLGLRVVGETHEIRVSAARRAAHGHEAILFLVEARSAEDIAHLARLNEEFPGRPIMALVDPAADPSLFLRAMRAGAAQVVRVPLQVEDFRVAVERLAIQFGFSPARAEAVVVAGVKPGCGATTVALNLAAEAAHGLELPTILLELSAGLGRLANYLNVEPSYTTHDVLADPARLDTELVRRSLTTIDEGFQILASPYRSIRQGVIHPELAQRLIVLARGLSGGLVVNLPGSFDETYFEAMAAASRVVLVVEQKVSSLYALRMLHDTLEERGVAAERVVVINRFDPRLKDITLARVEEIAGQGNVMTVANDYAAVVAAENHGCLLRLESPRSGVIADIHAIARRVFGRPAANPSETRRASFSWLARRTARA
jgi:pilus assembly protein CpaE